MARSLCHWATTTVGQDGQAAGQAPSCQGAAAPAGQDGKAAQHVFSSTKEPPPPPAGVARPRRGALPFFVRPPPLPARMAMRRIALHRNMGQTAQRRVPLCCVAAAPAGQDGHAAQRAPGQHGAVGVRVTGVLLVIGRKT